MKHEAQKVTSDSAAKARGQGGQHWAGRRGGPPARSTVQLGTARAGGLRPSYEACDDLELLGHVLNQDERAWETFFTRFRGLILSCAMKVSTRSGAHLDADELMDVLGEVYVNMIAKDCRRLRLYRVDGGCSVATWIGVIASSTAKDHLRKNRRHRIEALAEADLDRLACDRPSPEAEMLDVERRELIDQALSTQFSERDRQFVELYFGEAQAPEAIAETMGVSVSTVYSKKAKIKARLTRIAQETV